MATRYNYTGGIVTNGLVLNLDAAKTDSYPGTGTTWRDLSGNSNNGTLTNGPTFSGIGKQASIVFDGVDDYADYGTSLGNGWSQITVQAWVKPTTFPNTNFIFEHLVVADDDSSGGLESVFALIISHNNNTTSLPISFRGNTIHFGIRTSNQGNRLFPIGIPDQPNYLQYLPSLAISVNPIEYALNTWMFLTGTFNGSETKLYINGQFKATSNNQPDGVNRSLTGVLNTSSISRRIGISSLNSSPFTGNIPTVQIYNRALSAQEVTQNFNALRGRYGI
jgi:hypothetical protein